MLKTILIQLKRAGFKIIVAHGHSPSTEIFAENAKIWQGELGLELYICWKEGEVPKVGLQTDHAAANETALMMALKPELVKISNLPQDLNTKPLGLLGEDPRKHASADLGRKIINRQINNMEKLLRKSIENLKNIN
jgi:creatinine amidohydrolase